jgi:hypothetical protein
VLVILEDLRDQLRSPRCPGQCRPVNGWSRNHVGNTSGSAYRRGRQDPALDDYFAPCVHFEDAA